MFLKEIKPKKKINKNELHKLNSQLQIEQKQQVKQGSSPVQWTMKQRHLMKK